MIVCLCRGLSEDAIRAVIAAGASTVRDVSTRCGAGAECRVCCPMLAVIIERARDAVCAGGEK